MILPFYCKDHRGTALVDTGASLTIINPEFLSRAGIELQELRETSRLAIADGRVTEIRGGAIMDVGFSRRWLWLRIHARPLPLGNLDMLFGADLA